MKRRFFFLAMMIGVATLDTLAQPRAEIRGVWVDRSSLVSRDEIRATMQQLASANFNIAYINCWSRGYPLWPSKVFERETGILIDPNFTGRDVMREAVEEGKAAGIEVAPWPEYGFIGGWSGYLPGNSGKGVIFDRHPEWLAKTRAGDDRFTAPSGFFYWMVHTRPDVQKFLLDLMEELARNYDVTGIQFDRARYPQLDCGYDDYTIQLYQSEHNGQAPPSDPANTAWVRWRADKNNVFVNELARRLKGVNRVFQISNAPGVFPFAYVNFAQDYPGWVRAGALDYVVPQIYRANLAAYEAELDRQIAAVTDTHNFIPGVDVTNSNAEELIKMIEATRQRKLGGVVVWYHRGLLNANAFEKLKATVFAAAAYLPWKRPPTARRAAPIR
jgi:uncharacterized lipoprotein YddW (UPF0748 family)